MSMNIGLLFATCSKLRAYVRSGTGFVEDQSRLQSTCSADLICVITKQTIAISDICEVNDQSVPLAVTGAVVAIIQYNYVICSETN